MRDLKISDISAASPDMDDAQFNEFVDDIRQHGQLVPIWISNGEVVDGRKRLRSDVYSPNEFESSN